MEKVNYPCPCGGHIKWKRERVTQQGIDCGILDVEVCPKCGTKYLPDESMEIVEKKLKENGLWGVKRKEIKFWKSGNTITIRIPTEITKQLGLDNLTKGYIYQEGKNRLTIDF